MRSLISASIPNNPKITIIKPIPIKANVRKQSTRQGPANTPRMAQCQLLFEESVTKSFVSVKFSAQLSVERIKPKFRKIRRDERKLAAQGVPMTPVDTTSAQTNIPIILNKTDKRFLIGVLAILACHCEKWFKFYTAELLPPTMSARGGRGGFRPSSGRGGGGGGGGGNWKNQVMKASYQDADGGDNDDSKKYKDVQDGYTRGSEWDRDDANSWKADPLERAHKEGTN